MPQYSFLISSILILLIDSVYLNLFSGYFANQVKNVQNSSLKLNLTGAVLEGAFLCNTIMPWGLDNSSCK